MVKAVSKNLVEQLKRPARQAVSFWRQPVFRDRLFIGFSLGSALITIIIITLLVLNVRPRNFVVPLQYSSIQGFDVLGAWYRVYVYGVFSILLTVGNSYLASLSYRRSRMVSFFLVFGAAIINLLTLVIVVTLISNLET